MADKSIELPEKSERTVPLAPILKILECAVCLAMVKIPFKLCHSGHLVCCECAETLPKCPTCRAAFSLENPVSVRNLIEALPRQCKYDVNGCKELVEPGGDHEIFCRYREAECFQCDKNVQVAKMKDHYVKFHLGNVFFSQKCQLRLSQFGDHQGSFIYKVLFLAFVNTSLWLTVTNNTKQEMTKIVFGGDLINESTDKYFIILKFEREDIGTRVTLKASENPNIASEEVTCSIKLVYSALEHCINEENALEIDYELVAKPKSKQKSI